MGNKKMPDWMMDYVASIGEESYREYRNLSERYYREINDYNERIYPTQNTNYKQGFNTFNIEKEELDSTDAIEKLDERYKKEALNIACKFGYERPADSFAEYDKVLTQLQENSRFSSILKEKGSKPLSFEDIIAKEAHRTYFEKHPEAKKDHEHNKKEFRQIEKEEIEPDALTSTSPEGKGSMQKSEGIKDKFSETTDLSKQSVETHEVTIDKDDIDDIEIDRE